MMNEQSLELSNLDSGERLRVFDGPLLERAPDRELQDVVESAAKVTGFPIALVSLVASRIQFFKAHVGLPPELEAARATDRCSSFCQFVVTSAQPLVVEDATEHPALPQELVRLYGIRAYVGLPLRLMGQTMGTLCVLDVQPRRLEPRQFQRLQRLAARANERLESLAVNWTLSGQGLSSPSVRRNRFETFEREPISCLSEQFAAGVITPEQFQRAIAALSTLAGTLVHS